MIKLTTNHGVITIELDTEKAPISAQNFKQYVESGFYDNTLFHRVIDGFMVQGGGFDTNMVQKASGKPIQNEASNGLTNDRGTLAMARTSDPHSATAQFFINLVDNDFLNYRESFGAGWGYCVFGKVVEGMDIVDKICKVRTSNKLGHQDVPVENVVIESAEVV